MADASSFDINQLLQNPLFMGGVSGLLAPRDQRAKALLGGMQTASTLKSQAQQQELNAYKLQQMQAQANFDPSQYMQTAPVTQGSAAPAALQGLQQSAAPMPATLGGPNAGSMQQDPIQQPVALEQGTPTGRVDMQAMLGAGLKAGMTPAEISQIAAVQDPQGAAEAARLGKTYTLTPGQVVKDAGNGVIASNDAMPQNSQVVQIQQLTAARDKARAAGDMNGAANLQSALDKMTGAFDQQARVQQMQQSQDNAEANRGLREDSLAMRRQQMGMMADQRTYQHQQNTQQQMIGLTKQLETAGLPQAEQTLQNIESKIPPKGDIPGFDRMTNTLSKVPGGTALMSADAQTMRQAVQPLVNVVLKTRSGAAVTNPEWDRFKQELGTGAFMSSDRLRQGLASFRSLVDSQKRNIAAGQSDDVLAAYEGSGGMPLSQFRQKGARKSVSLNDATMDDIDAAIAAKQGQ